MKKCLLLLLFALPVSLQCMEIDSDEEKSIEKIDLRQEIIKLKAKQKEESKKSRVLMEKEGKALIEFNVHYDNVTHIMNCTDSSSIHTWTMCGTEQEAQKIKEDVEFLFQKAEGCYHCLIESRLDNNVKPIRSGMIPEAFALLIQSIFNEDPKCIPYTIKEIVNEAKNLDKCKVDNSRVDTVVDYIKKHMGELPEEIEEDLNNFKNIYNENCKELDAANQQ